MKAKNPRPSKIPSSGEGRGIDFSLEGHGYTMFKVTKVSKVS